MPETTRGPRALGTKQSIAFTLNPKDFGDTEDEKKACLAGLVAVDVIDRDSLIEHLYKSGLGLLESCRKAGVSEVERARRWAEDAEQLKLIERLSEMRGETVEVIAEQIGFVPYEPEEKAISATDPMVVTIAYSGKKDDPGVEYEAWCAVKMAGDSISLGNMGECPEDANLGRDLGFIYNLPDRLQNAWQAGRDGREFRIDVVENAEH